MKSPIRSRRSHLRSLFSFLFLLLLSPHPAPAETAPPLALWSEFQSDAEVTAALPMLARDGIALYLNIPSTRIGDPGIANLIESAAAHGVPCKAWITLPYDQGYWPGETNRVLFRSAVEAFVAWVQAEALPVSWIVFDMEIDFATAQQIGALGQAIAEGDLRAIHDLYRVFAETYDREAFLAAAADYAALVDALHEAGFLAQVTTYPTVLDDLYDGDPDLQDITDTPVVVAEVPIDWDLLSFMVYRTIYGETRFTADLVYRYSRQIVRSFGEKGAIDLGVVGYDELSQSGYREVSGLQADYAAAMAAGIPRIHVYALDGILDLSPECLEGPSCPWTDLAAVSPRRPLPDPSVGVLRRALRHADRWLSRLPSSAGRTQEHRQE